jgi:hypothetical protein
MEHETDYQRARRQRSDIKKYGITGSTPKDAAKRIKEHVGAKAKALEKKSGMDTHKRWGNSAMKGYGVNSPAMMEARKKHHG